MKGINEFSQRRTSQYSSYAIMWTWSILRHFKAGALRSFILLGALSCIWFTGLAQNNISSTFRDVEVQEITFKTADGITIFGDLFIMDKDLPIILLFHQGGANARSEYKEIIPELLKEEFNLLAIDQRMGGQYFGGYNRTLVQIEDHNYSNPYGYCDAYNNLEGALDFVIESGFKGLKILWGSSYSASLAIQLANKRPQDVDGVLSFSPASGTPLADCDPFQYLEDLRVACLILRPPSEMQSDRSKEQFELAENLGHQTFVPTHGVHGSSMLVSKRVGNEVNETWDVVNAFLNDLRRK